MQKETTRLHFLRIIMILCACMVFFGAKMNAFAEEREEEIKVGDTKEVVIGDPEDEVIFKFIPEEDGSYIISTIYEEDGPSPYVLLFDEEGKEIGNLWGIGESVSQLSAGETYYYHARSYEPGAYAVKLERNDVKSISYETVKTEYIENTDGYTSYGSDGECYIYSLYSVEGDKLTVVHEDGSETEYIYGPDSDFNFRFINTSDENDTLDWNDVVILSDQEEHPWGVGADNYYTVTYRNCSCDVYVSVVENPVASISFEPAEPINIVEHTYGDWQEVDGEKWFYYNPWIFKAGSILIVNKTDGTSVEYHLSTGGDVDDYFVSEDGDIINIGWSADELAYNADDQSIDHWIVGGTYNIDLSYMGKSCQVPISIVENPIASISFKPAEPISVILNAYGNWVTDEEGEWFQYTETDSWVYNKGNKLTIDYADGRKVEYTCKYDEDEGDYAFVSEDGEALYRWGDNEVSFNTNQYVKHWTLGEDNYLTIAYKGRECPVKVAVVESSVESFEFEPAKPIQLINNTGGEMDYNDETGEEYYLYWDFDPFVEGSKLIVHYKDGTTKIFNHQYDEDDFSCYVTEDGKDTIPVFSYGGVWYYDNQASDHWLMDKDNYLMISYQGMDYPIPVEIIESSVQSIEFEPGTDLYVYENGEGYYDNEFEQFIYDEPYPFTEGSKLIVHYKDDTSKTYFYQHDEKTKEDSYVSEDGDVIPADSSYGIWYEADQNSAPWSLGSDNYMNIHYLDVSCPVQVEVKKNLVDSISYESAVDVVFTEGKNIWSYQEEGERYFEEYNYAPSAGDRLTVNYIDESQETFTYVENKGFVNDKDAGNVLRESNFRYRPDQSEKLWAYGTGNDFMITYLGKSTTIQVTYKERETEPSEDEKAVAKVKALIEKANETFDSSAKAYEAVNAAQAALNALSKEQRALLMKEIPDPQKEIDKAQAKAKEQERKEKEEAGQGSEGSDKPGDKSGNTPGNNPGTTPAKTTIPSTGITVAKKKIYLKKGDKYSLSYILAPLNTTDTVTYTTSNKKVATVSPAGKITAKAKGTAMITIRTASGRNVNVKVIVAKKATKTKSLKVSKKMTMNVGQVKFLKYTRKPAKATEKVSFKASKKAVVSVDSNGKLIAIKKGTAKITIKSGKKKAVCKITVK